MDYVIWMLLICFLIYVLCNFSFSFLSSFFFLSFFLCYFFFPSLFFLFSHPLMHTFTCTHTQNNVGWIKMRAGVFCVTCLSTYLPVFPSRCRRNFGENVHIPVVSKFHSLVRRARSTWGLPKQTKAGHVSEVRI